MPFDIMGESAFGVANMTSFWRSDKLLFKTRVSANEAILQHGMYFAFRKFYAKVITIIPE